MSIWSSISRVVFEANILELEQLTRSQNAAELLINRNEAFLNQSHDRGCLPHYVERQVVEDFAFFAAWTTTAEAVTATTFTCAGPHRLGQITVAANGGVPGKVKNGLTKILEMLELCARCEVSRQSAAEDCLKIVLNLQRNKVLGRIGSAKYKPPKKKTLQQVQPIAQRLKTMVAVLEANTMNASLIGDIESLLDNLSISARSAPDKEIESLELVVKAAYRLAIDGTQLRNRLKSAAYPPEYCDRIEIRQTLALANYWRACRYLCEVARRYRQIFSSCKVDAIATAPCEIWPEGSGQKHFVHAEIQLLIYHDINNQLSPPTYIGVSKKACFLCSSFIRGHGLYASPRTHGEVYSQWTVPDRAGICASIKERWRVALEATDKDVVEALKRAKESKIQHVAKAQSAVNSAIGTISTASASTIKQAAFAKQEGGFCVELIGDEAETDSLSTISGAIEPTISHAEYARSGRKVRLAEHWLEIYLHVEDHDDSAADEEGKSGCCLLCNDPGSEGSTANAAAYVDILDLEEGSFITLERPSNSSYLQVVFTAPGKCDMFARFSWSAARSRE